MRIRVVKLLKFVNQMLNEEKEPYMTIAAAIMAIPVLALLYWLVTQTPKPWEKL